jgi:23S rRNA pseudouridine1911/1915/1917 synthase
MNEEQPIGPEPQDDELYEHYSFTASKGQEPLRVDKFFVHCRKCDT